MPMLCRTSPKCVSLVVMTILAGARKRSWSARTKRWLASTFTAKVDSSPSGVSVRAFVCWMPALPTKQPTVLP